MSATQHPETPAWLREQPGLIARLALPVILVLLSCAAFWPATSAGLIQYDDPGFLKDVDGWRGLGAANIRWMFSTMHLGHYQPLTYLSYALELELFGISPEKPEGYHVTNILLHAGSAVLLYHLALLWMRVAARDGRTLPDASGAMHVGAFLCALFWGIHPLRTESVAWVTERRDVLSTFFLLCAATAYTRYACARGGQTIAPAYRWYAASVAFLLLSLFSKAWGMSFFVLAILLDIFPLRRLPWQPWRWLRTPRVLVEKLPHAALGVVFMVLAGRAQSSAQFTMRTLAEWGVASRVSQACYGLVFYIRKTLLPTNLSALYELPRVAPPAQAQWLVGIVLVVAASAGLLWLLIKRPRVGVPVCVAVGAYVVLVAPVLGLVQSGIQLVAERYSYIAVMPLLALAGAGVSLALSSGRVRGMGLFAGGALACVAAGLCVLGSWRQSHLWHDAVYLWEDAIAHGHEGPMLRGFYAQRLSQLATTDEALAQAKEQYERCLALDNAHGPAWVGLGAIAYRQGDHATAEHAFKKALSDKTQRLKALISLGVLYAHDLARPREALDLFLQAAKENDDAGNPQKIGRPAMLVGATYDQLGDASHAMEWLEKAATFRDTADEAQRYLAQLRRESAPK